ncbi:MAG: hypothetical protein Kow0059_10470 [Candidatus Sumerlaeia bacterium]
MTLWTLAQCGSVWSYPPQLPIVSYTVKDLGVLSGDDQSYAYGVNDRGHVTGGSRQSSTNQSRPFFYSPATGIIQILSPGVSFARGEGRAVNDTDWVIGWRRVNPSPPSDAFVSYQTYFNYVNPIEQGGNGIELYDLTNTGLAAGFSNTSTGLRPAIFGFGRVAELDILSGEVGGIGYGINDLGYVVGISWSNIMIESNAVFWQGSNVQKLKTLGGMYAAAYKINNTAQIVGQSGLLSNTATHGCMWNTPGSDPTDVGTLGGTNSALTDINDAGDVVGSSQITGDGEFHACIRYAGSTNLVDLNDLIPPGSGWVLVSADGLSDRGYICGMGLHNGQTRAFLLTPVPPPYAVAYYPFNEGGQLLGWTTLTSIPPFDPVTITAGASGLEFSAGTSFPAYGFAQSPPVSVSDQYRYRATFRVTTDQSDRTKVPRFRLRIYQPSANLSWVQAVDSIGNNAPAAGEVKSYTVEFRPVTWGGDSNIHAAVDLTHFNPEDNGQAKIILGEVVIEVISE